MFEVCRGGELVGEDDGRAVVVEVIVVVRSVALFEAEDEDDSVLAEIDELVVVDLSVVVDSSVVVVVELELELLEAAVVLVAFALVAVPLATVGTCVE